MDKTQKALMRQLARRGAVVRLQELDTERKALLAFLRNGAAPPPPPVDGGRFDAQRLLHDADAAGVTHRIMPARAVATDAAPKAKRKKYRMSAAQKRAVSQRMRRYWAQRRKAEEAGR